MKEELESVVTYKHFEDLNDYIFDFDSDPTLNNKELFGKEIS